MKSLCVQHPANALLGRRALTTSLQKTLPESYELDVSGNGIWTDRRATVVALATVVKCWRIVESPRLAALLCALLVECAACVSDDGQDAYCPILTNAGVDTRLVLQAARSVGKLAGRAPSKSAVRAAWWLCCCANQAHGCSVFSAEAAGHVGGSHQPVRAGTPIPTESIVAEAAAVLAACIAGSWGADDAPAAVARMLMGSVVPRGCTVVGPNVPLLVLHLCETWLHPAWQGPERVVMVARKLASTVFCQVRAMPMCPCTQLGPFLTCTHRCFLGSGTANADHEGGPTWVAPRRRRRRACAAGWPRLSVADLAGSTRVAGTSRRERHCSRFAWGDGAGRGWADSS